MKPMLCWIGGLLLVPALAGQQPPDSTYAPLLRPGQRLNGAWTSATRVTTDSIRADRYSYVGKRDEFLRLTLNAGFGGFLLVAMDVQGKTRVIAGSDSIRPVSNVELKLPVDGRYLIVAGAKSTGSYTLVAHSEGSVSELDWAALYPGGGDPAERYALLVGVNDYPGERNDLRGGPLVDVDLMREVLTGKLGFKPENVLVLRDLEGNREQVIQAFRRHLGQAGPKGAAVFYYSGHGIQLAGNRDPAGAVDKEADDRDEALALWGSQGDLYGYLLDDELGALIDELKTDRVLIVLDDCHSGTATRGAESRTWEDVMGRGRAAPQTIRKFAAAMGTPVPTVQDKRVDPGDIASELERPFVTLKTRDTAARRTPVVLAASDDSETALGVALTLDSGATIQVGLFTVLLYRAVMRGPSTQSIQSLFDLVSPVVTEQATKISGKPQTPRLSGGAVLKQSLLRFLAKAPPR